ncbi:MAG: hypothetical protein JEZ00_06685 [Anaerolineaceae bacterium]|nr:hypothetical protein [Anaerolineaceae bacterium]
MESVSGTGMMRGMPPGMPPGKVGMGGNQSLSEEQKTQLEEILEEYDAASLTEEEVESILDQMRNAGIQPGKGMKETIEAAGFDANMFKPAGRSDGPPPPPPGGAEKSQGINLESLQSLQTILNQFDLSNLSAEDEESLISSIQQAGFMSPGNLFTIDA